MGKSGRKISEEFTRKPDRAFRRSVWLQIYFPLIFVILLVAGLVSILWIGDVGTSSGWADTALIFLILPALLAGLIFLAILVGLCYGIILLIGWIPGPSKQGQELVERAAVMTRRFADLLARPFIAPRAVKTAIVEAIRYLASIFARE